MPCVGKEPLQKYQLHTIIRVVEHKGGNKACATRMKDNGPPSFLQCNKSKSCQEQWHWLILLQEHTNHLLITHTLNSEMRLIEGIDLDTPKLAPKVPTLESYSLPQEAPV